MKVWDRDRLRVALIRMGDGAGMDAGEPLGAIGLDESFVPPDATITIGALSWARGEHAIHEIAHALLLGLPLRNVSEAVETLLCNMGGGDLNEVDAIAVEFLVLPRLGFAPELVFGILEEVISTMDMSFTDGGEPMRPVAYAYERRTQPHVRAVAKKILRKIRDHYNRTPPTGA